MLRFLEMGFNGKLGLKNESFGNWFEGYLRGLVIDGHCEIAAIVGAKEKQGLRTSKSSKKNIL